MAETLSFDVIARDHASQTFSRVAQSTEMLETRFARLTNTARNVATTLVGAQIGKSVLDAADKFELSHSRLETITKNIGGNFKELSGQVDSADKRMAAFGFTSADTEGALASLESVTKNPTRALKDLALAADIARGRNIGLNEATLILQRVETGHIAQLAKLGIATKDAAGNTLTQVQALQMLTDLYSGSASQFADTFAGKQAAVRAELQNSAAEIGVALLPAAVDLAKAIQHDLLPPLIATVHWLDENKKTIEPLAKAVLFAVGAWKAYSLATRAAVAITATMGRTSITTAAQVAAGTRGLPDLRSPGGVAGAETALLSLRQRALGALPYAAGFGATVGGSFLGGTAGNALTGAGTGAMIGSAVPGVGTLLGAITGALVSQLGKGGTHANQDQFNLIATLPGGTKKLQDLIGLADKAGFGAGKKLKEMAQAALDAAANERNLGSALDHTTAAMQRQADEVVSAGRAALNVKAAQDALRASMRTAAQVAADNGKALLGNSDAALANRDALRNEVTQVYSVIDAMKAHGESGARQQAMLEILTTALENNAIKIYGDKKAVDDLLLSLGLLPGAVDLSVQALADLPTLTQSQFTTGDVTPGAIHQLNEAVGRAKDNGKKIADSFTSGYTPIVSKAATEAAKKATDAFNKLKDKMRSDLQSIRDAIDSTRSSVAGFADFSATGTDSFGGSGANTDVRGQLQAKAAKLEQFARLFNQLDRASLDPHLMAQFAQIGPDAIPAMQALLHSGRRGIGQVNRIEQRIQTAAGSVATTETALQNSGLIHRDLEKLPRRLASEFRNELAKLHIITDTHTASKKSATTIRALA